MTAAAMQKVIGARIRFRQKRQEHQRNCENGNARHDQSPLASPSTSATVQWYERLSVPKHHRTLLLFAG